MSAEIEALSAELHAIYQQEAHRQAANGEDTVRHPDEYEALPERTKEYDRVLARFILAREQKLRQELVNAINTLWTGVSPVPRRGPEP